MRRRNARRGTAGDKTIDGDMILAAQAVTFGAVDFVIATTNVDHLSRFANAKLMWRTGPHRNARVLPPRGGKWACHPKLFEAEQRWRARAAIRSQSARSRRA